MNKYQTSNGQRISQATINRRLAKAYAEDRANIPGLCDCCGLVPPVDHDHTISQKRCKELQKTELIYSRSNWVYSCRKCHREWESYKSGAYLDHLNASARMIYLKQTDPETYKKRIHWHY